MRRTRLAIIATHPIQYHAPWFRALALRPELDVVVGFVRIPDPAKQGEGFATSFQWDLPLLDGYAHTRLETALLWPSRPYFSERLRGFSAWLARERVEVLLATGWNEWSLLQAALEAHARKIPVIARGDTNGLLHRPLWKRLIHRRLLNLYQAFLVAGESNHRFYAGHRIAAERLWRAPHFVENTRFAHQAAELRGQRRALRQGWQIEDDETCFVFAGKLQPVKRIADLLEAVRLAAADGARLRLLVVGTGEQMTHARALVAEHRLPVTFAGFLNQTQIAQAYVAADCLVLPSDWETWGLVVNEAMACGCPAILSDRVGSYPDLILPEETGEIFAFADSRALADLMLKYSGRPELLEQMGRKAQNYVLLHHSVERSAQAVVDAVRHVQQGGA